MKDELFKETSLYHLGWWLKDNKLIKQYSIDCDLRGLYLEVLTHENFWRKSYSSSPSPQNFNFSETSYSGLTVEEFNQKRREREIKYQLLHENKNKDNSHQRREGEVRGATERETEMGNREDDMDVQNSVCQKNNGNQVQEVQDEIDVISPNNEAPRTPLKKSFVNDLFGKMGKADTPGTGTRTPQSKRASSSPPKPPGKDE